MRERGMEGEREGGREEGRKGGRKGGKERGREGGREMEGERGNNDYVNSICINCYADLPSLSPPA